MIIPSIDLQNGRAVQLRQGKEHVLTDERDPIKLAQIFNRYGPVSVVDLDGAMGKGDNLELICQICSVAEVRAGGGIRNVERARALLKAGATQLVIGTAATPEFLQNFLAEQIIVALDHRKGKLVDKGWTRQTEVTIEDRAKEVADYCSGYLCTFVEDEGGLTGMDQQEILRLKEVLPHRLTVAGGVANTKEAIAIGRLGVEVQVGMALYTGKLDLGESVVGILDFAKVNNLMPTVVQAIDGQVLMLAYSSPSSLSKALHSGKGIYYSRSRKEIWEKGLTSGNSQALVSVRMDCDRDALLFKVKQAGVACHDGRRSCFGAASFSLNELFEIIAERMEERPDGSYVTELLKDEKLLNDKILEEAKEITVSSTRENLRWECGDLIFHLAVKASKEGLSLTDIVNELSARHKRKKGDS